MTALVLVLAAVALVELAIRARHRSRHDDRGTTTYWYRGQPITRHDYDALTRLHTARHPADPTTSKEHHP